jgi:hypothetical protein
LGTGAFNSLGSAFAGVTKNKAPINKDNIAKSLIKEVLLGV